MRASALLVLSLLLGGCAASWPEQASLNPQVAQQAAGLYQGQSLSLQAQDKRLASQVITIKLDGEPEVRVPNQVAPAELLRQKLEQGFAKQGLSQGGMDSPEMTLIINALEAQVTKPGLLYKTRTQLQIKLELRHNGLYLGKSFGKNSSEDSATRPDVPGLEKTLNQQLSSLLDQVLTDQEIRSFIKG